MHTSLLTTAPEHVLGVSRRAHFEGLAALPCLLVGWHGGGPVREDRVQQDTLCIVMEAMLRCLLS